MNTVTALKIPSRSVALAFLLVILGAAAVIYGVTTDPRRTWPHLLLNGFYIVSLGVSAAFFLATQRATGARWSAALRRIPEAFMMALPVASILMTLLLFERQNLFPWSRPGPRKNYPARQAPPTGRRVRRGVGTLPRRLRGSKRVTLPCSPMARPLPLRV